MTLEGVRRWFAKRRVDRLWRRHAEWTADAINLIGETNPTLASVTWQKVRQMMNAEPLPESSKEAQERLVAVLDLVMEAVAQEERRLAV